MHVKDIKKYISLIFYRLTSRIPRRLPQTKEEYEHLKYVLIQYFGLAEDPTTWYTMASEITGTPRHQLYRSYRGLANVGIRFAYVNAVAQDFKQLAGMEIQANLEKKAKELIKDEEPQEYSGETVGLNGDTREIKPNGWSDVPGQAHGIS